VLTDHQEALAAELRADRAYATGRRAFPRTLTPDDAVAITGELHETLDGGAEVRATAARNAGRPLACARGCTGCCEEMVMVFRPEALRIARWLELPENAATRQAFLEAYAAWKQKVGDAPQRLSAVFASGDEAGHRRLHLEVWRQRILCAFNQGGACTIYPVRPLLCRNAHAVGTAEHCYADDPSGKPPTRMRSKELDAWVEEARAALRAMHHALGGPRLSPASVCDAVAELLTPRS
jgi:hypothetical protein